MNVHVVRRTLIFLVNDILDFTNIDKGVPRINMKCDKAAAS